MTIHHPASLNAATCGAPRGSLVLSRTAYDCPDCHRALGTAPAATLYDGSRVEETPFEAEQRRGRERMIGLWRSAVATVTEAAERATERQREGVAPSPVLTEDAAARGKA